MFELALQRIGGVVLGLGLLVSGARAGVDQYMIDSSRTRVRFEMRSFGVAQYGEFDRAAGTVAVDADTGVGSVDIMVDARSLEAGSAAMNHLLRGPSMLNVESYPQIVYRAHRLVFADGVLTRIDGELTMRGVTRAVPLHVSEQDCSTQQPCSVVATARFKRSEFGMTRYRILADDEVRLEIHAHTSSH